MKSNMLKLVLVILALLFLLVEVQAADVTLAWDANPDSRVTGYKLYLGTSSGAYGAPVDVGKVTQFTLTGVKEGVDLFFAVTAYDTPDKLESAYSTELPCWTLIPSVTGSGTITPAVTKVVSAINAQVFTISPSAGFRIKDVSVDGVSAGPMTSYTFPAGVSTSHSIKATFELIPAPVPKATGLKLVS